MKVDMYKLFSQLFHVVIGLANDYGAIQLSHYNF
jgi:hypothetical protein